MYFISYLEWRVNYRLNLKLEDTCCPIFGLPEEFHTNILPTLGDAMRYYSLVQNRMKPNDTTKEPT